MSSIDFLRQYRVVGYAIFDLTITFIGMALLAYPLSKLFAHFGVKIPKISWLYFALPIGILVHILVGKYTPMTLQFLNPNGNYFLKIVIVILLILGFAGIRLIKK